jgi:hypothetical protein
MKKLATILVIAAVAFMASCGPSAKEKEAKRIADSIRVADSMAMVQAQQQRVADSIAKVQAAQKKIADSIAHADSVAKHLIKPAKPAKGATKKGK